MALNALDVTQKLSALLSQTLEETYQLATILKSTRWEIEGVAEQLASPKCCCGILLDYCKAEVDIALPLVKATCGTIALVEELGRRMYQCTEHASELHTTPSENWIMCTERVTVFTESLKTERLTLQLWISAYQTCSLRYLFTHARKFREGVLLPAPRACVLACVLGIPKTQMYDLFTILDLWEEESSRLRTLNRTVFRRNEASAWEVMAWVDTQNGRVREWEIPEVFDDPPPSYTSLEAAGLIKANAEGSVPMYER